MSIVQSVSVGSLVPYATRFCVLSLVMVMLVLLKTAVQPVLTMAGIEKRD